MYHSGIVVDGLEYTYDSILDDGLSGSGVVAHAPYYTDPEKQVTLPLRCTIILGTSRLSATASHKLLRSLGSLWLAHAYDLVEQNCHHWVTEASAALEVAPPPRWVTRASELLQFCSGMPSRESRAPRQGESRPSPRCKAAAPKRPPVARQKKDDPEGWAGQQRERDSSAGWDEEEDYEATDSSPLLRSSQPALKLSVEVRRSTSTSLLSGLP